MKRTFTFLALLILAGNAYSQTPNWLWTASGTTTGYGYCSALAIDTAGNLFISGRGTLMLGGLTNTADNVPYVGKYDGAGNGIWLTSNYHISGFAYTDALCIDSKDNAYITSCDGSGSSIYVQGFNSAGNVAWTTNVPGAICRGSGIVADNFGNIYSSGYYGSSAITFGAKILPVAGAYSGYLVKQDTAGNFRWATHFSSTGTNYVSGKRVAADENGNVYVVGAYQGIATFYSANNTDTINTTASAATGGFSDLFIAEYDSTGNVLWVTTVPYAGLAYNSYAYGNCIAIDSCGNLYVAGIFESTATFGNISVTSQGGQDVFVAKYNVNSGTWEWVEAGGSAGADYAEALTLDKNSDVYVTGTFAGNAASFGSLSLSSGVSYVAKYNNSNGAIQWLQSVPNNSSVVGIAVDKQKYVYVLGAATSNILISKLDTVLSNTITPLVASNYCPGSTSNLPYIANGTFNAGNVFTAQLSDSAGGFASPTNIGSVTSTNDGSISITIPSNTPTGTNYLVRVVSSNPATSSYASGCGAYGYANNFYVSIGGGTTITVSNDTLICAGLFAQLHASGANSYSWSPGNTLNDSTSANPYAAPVVSQTYTVTATSGCGSITKTVAVNVIPGVNITVNPFDMTVCAGSSVTLHANGATSYSWAPGFALNDSTIANPIAFPIVSTTFTVTGNDGTCSNTAVVVINVGNTAVGGTLSAFLMDTICWGMSGSIALSGNSNNTIQWQSSEDDINFTNLSGDTLSTLTTDSLKQSAWFRVVVGNGNCSATSDTLRLYVPPQSLAIINASDSVTTVTFNADVYSGDIKNYFWDFGDGQTASIASPVHTYDSAGIYRVCLTITSFDGCTSNECTNVTVYTVNKCLAYFGLYPDNNNPHHWFILNQSKGAAPINYNWSWGDGNTSTGQTPSHTYVSAGSYTICLNITDDTLCTSNLCDSALYLFRLEGNTQVFIDVVTMLPTGIANVAGNQPLTVYPNPFAGELDIKTNSELTGSIGIYDVLGRLIISQQADNINAPVTLNVSALSKGMYFVIIKTADADYVQKVVKQ